jgi:outer membrane lipoprotein-sorting protein
MKMWMRLMPALVLLAGAAVRGEETLEAVQKRLESAAERVQALSYTVEGHSEFDAEGFKQQTNSRIKWDLKRKGKLDLFRTEAKTENITSQGKSESTITSAFDGEVITTLTESPEAKLAFKQKPAEETSMVPRGAALLDQLKEGYELKVLPNEKVEGRDAMVLEQTFKGPAPAGTPARYKLWLDTESGLMLKRIGYGPKDVVISEEVAKDIKINPNLPDEHFKLKIPEGVQVFDMTQQPPESTGK